jgi:hypothetical protein
MMVTTICSSGTRINSTPDRRIEPRVSDEFHGSDPTRSLEKGLGKWTAAATMPTGNLALSELQVLPWPPTGRVKLPRRMAQTRDRSKLLM